MSNHHDVVIIGGGNAGVSLAARLRRYGVKDIALIEPKDHHLYQPLFSHIAGGRAEVKEAIRSQSSVTPKGVAWIKDKAVDVDTTANAVLLATGRTVSYQHLVVCPGLQYQWDAVPGLAEAVRSPYGASHYEFELAPKTWSLLRSVRSGTVIFTMPSGPIKCGGASQKPMYLACDYWREQGVLDNIRVVMVQPYPTVFGVPEVDRELERIIAGYGIELRTNSELVAVDPVAGRQPSATSSPAQQRTWPTTSLMRCRPSRHRTGWRQRTCLPGRMDSAGRMDLSKSIPRRCATSASLIFGPSATPQPPPIPRPAARCGSRPRCWPGTWLPRAVENRR